MGRAPGRFQTETKKGGSGLPTWPSASAHSERFRSGSSMGCRNVLNFADSVGASVGASSFSTGTAVATSSAAAAARGGSDRRERGRGALTAWDSLNAGRGTAADPCRRTREAAGWRAAGARPRAGSAADAISSENGFSKFQQIGDCGESNKFHEEHSRSPADSSGVNVGGAARSLRAAARERGECRQLSDAHGFFKRTWTLSTETLRPRLAGGAPPGPRALRLTRRHEQVRRMPSHPCVPSPAASRNFLFSTQKGANGQSRAWSMPGHPPSPPRRP